jgi:hypothetical protein
MGKVGNFASKVFRAAALAGTMVASYLSGGWFTVAYYATKAGLGINHAYKAVKGYREKGAGAISMYKNIGEGLLLAVAPAGLPIGDIGYIGANAYSANSDLRAERKEEKAAAKKAAEAKKG